MCSLLISLMNNALLGDMFLNLIQVSFIFIVASEYNV